MSTISELIMSPLLQLFALVMGLSAVTDLLCEVAMGTLAMTGSPSFLEKSSCLLKWWSELQRFKMASIRH